MIFDDDNDDKLYCARDEEGLALGNMFALN